MRGRERERERERSQKFYKNVQVEKILVKVLLQPKKKKKKENNLGILYIFSWY